MSLVRNMIFEDVVTELEKAREKFPTNKLLALAFAEESGEFIKAVLDYEQKGGSLNDIHKEAVQTIAMAIRLLEEGDNSLKYKGWIRESI